MTTTNNQVANSLNQNQNQSLSMKSSPNSIQIKTQNRKLQGKENPINHTKYQKSFP